MSKGQLSKGQSLQDPLLNILRREKIPVSVYLVNGIKLSGQIESFDQFAILLKNTGSQGNQVNQMVYKHAISTVVPTRSVRMTTNDETYKASEQRGDTIKDNEQHGTYSVEGMD